MPPRPAAGSASLTSCVLLLFSVSRRYLEKGLKSGNVIFLQFTLIAATSGRPSHVGVLRPASVIVTNWLVPCIEARADYAQYR
jgi:hypothetical protein